MIASIITKCRWSRLASLTSKITTYHSRTLSHLPKVSNSHHKFFSSDTEFDAENDFDSSDVTKLVDLREMLYPDSQDVIIKQLNQMTSLEDITGFLGSSIEFLSKEQFIQSLLILSELRAVDETTDEAPTQETFDMNQITQKLDTLIEAMTLQELVSSYLCLYKLGSKDLRSETTTKIINKIRVEIKTNEEFPLACLARYTFPFSQNKDLFALFLAVETLPHLVKHLEKCQSVEDLNFLTISLNNVNHLINREILEKYKAKVQEVLDNNLLNSTTSTTCILRIISLLNCYHWSFLNDKLIRSLSLELEECISSFDTRHLMTLHRAFQVHLESSKIQRAFVRRAQELIEDNPSIELLSLAVLHISPDQRTKIANLVRGILSKYQISSASTNDTLQMTFKILRLLKISDISLCDSFWVKCLNQIYGTKVQSVRYKIIQFINKYMFFNNNLGGSYRNIEFEKSVIEMAKDELKSPTSPREFSVFASFIIAYDDENEIAQWIVDKIDQIHDQLNVRDCWQISRGIQILNEMRLKQFITTKLANQMQFLNYSLEKSMMRHLADPDLHLSSFNKILKSYLIRRGEI